MSKFDFCVFFFDMRHSNIILDKLFDKIIWTSHIEI
nr:MAG TPA: hypothetical protein [Crassvirales sp.]